jgi:hypothetical protein
VTSFEHILDNVSCAFLNLLLSAGYGIGVGLWTHTGRPNLSRRVEMRSLTPSAGKVWRSDTVVDTGRQWHRAQVWIVAVKAVGDGNTQGSPPKQAVRGVDLGGERVVHILTTPGGAVQTSSHARD